MRFLLVLVFMFLAGTAFSQSRMASDEHLLSSWILAIWSTSDSIPAQPVRLTINSGRDGDFVSVLREIVQKEPSAVTLSAQAAEIRVELATHSTLNRRTSNSWEYERFARVEWQFVRPDSTLRDTGVRTFTDKIMVKRSDIAVLDSSVLFGRPARTDTRPLVHWMLPALALISTSMSVFVMFHMRSGS